MPARISRSGFTTARKRVYALLAEDWTIVNRAEELAAPAVASDPVVPAMSADAGPLDAADEGTAE